jgi:hypothetical protein
MAIFAPGITVSAAQCAVVGQAECTGITGNMLNEDGNPAISLAVRLQKARRKMD